MSAIQRSILGAALVLMVVMVSTTPAAAQFQPTGIWVELEHATGYWTLTVVNLTNEALSLVANNVAASGGQQPPFYGNTLNEAAAFPIPPYRNVTWKSNTETFLYPNPHWNGTLTLRPQGMDQQWTVTLNFQAYKGSSSNYKGTWAYLTAATNNWAPVAPDNGSCSYTGWCNTIYNVMMLSGTDLAVSLYAPSFNEDGPAMVDVTLVFQQRETSLVVPCLTYWDMDCQYVDAGHYYDCWH
jgi:hypothetical protein